MKQSNYNIFTSNSNGSYVFNSFSGCVVQLDKDKFDTLQNNQIDQFSKQEAEFLENNGILVSDECNEFFIISHLFRKTRYADNYLSITIVPTLGCNFACPYCYERNMTGRMDSEVWKAIADHVIKVGSNCTDIDVVSCQA